MSLRDTARQLILATALVMAPSAQAEAVAFEKIADTDTPIPDGSGTFTSFLGFFSVGPASSGRNVAFDGNGSASQRGIYASVGGQLSRVADKSTLVPGDVVTFDDFDQPSISGATVAFVGISGGGSSAVYSARSGSLSTIADLATSIPGGSGMFTGFASTSSDDDDIAFLGFGSSGQEGNYLWTGSQFEVISDNAAPVPGGSGFFLGHSIGSIQAGNASFCASDSMGNQGIYTRIGGQLDVVADVSTPIPNGSGTFSNFGFFESFDAGDVAFVGFGSGGQAGVYVGESGVLRRVADTSTPIPEGTGTFTSFPEFPGVSLSKGRVAFFASGALGQQGLYLEDGGQLEKILHVGDELDGKTVGFVLMSVDGLDRGRLAFVSEFSDGSTGVYVATLAEEIPAASATSVALLALALLAIARVAAIGWRRGMPASPHGGLP